MERLRCLSAVLLNIFLLWALAAALPTQTNVDTEEPSVIISPAQSDPEDGFGWSAVFHQVEEVVSGDQPADILRKVRVLIGAPRGTFPGGLPLEDFLLPRQDRTGLVYSCSVRGMCGGIQGDTSLYLPPTGPADATNGVTSVQFSMFPPPELSEGRLFDQAPNSMVATGPEQKTGQLMGSTLYSTGTNFLACAPLWNPDRRVLGLCFVGNRSLENFRPLLPCRSFRIDICLGGFSADIVNNFVLMAAPAQNSFAGSIFQTLTNNNSFTETTVTPLEGVFPLYTGWDITHGYISTNDRNLPASDFVLSSPRSGNVSYGGRISVVLASQLPVSGNPINSRFFLDGRQPAEFYGYSSVFCDLTGDGYDELVVGAPMYTLFDPLSPERGRIYVYFNNGGSLNVQPVLLEGMVSYGRFGFAVANLGDLNADGREDLAVGAPYESNGDNSGAVYVYYGRDTAEEFRSQTPQRILASDIVDSVSSLSNLRSFGFSLDGNMDVDANMHQDFLVGAPDTQTVVVLRTLPFVNVIVDISNISTPVNIDSANPGFEVNIMATYNSTIVTGPLNVTFNLTELPVGMAHRLFFAGGMTFFVGNFQFQQAGMPIVISVRVFSIIDINELTPYQLVLDILDFERNLPPVTGTQELSDLSAFPRLRLMGTLTVTVPIIDPCGTSGCTGDVLLNPVAPPTKELLAGQLESVVFNVSYENLGPEDGRSLMLALYNLPTKIFNAGELTSVQDGTPTTCPFQLNSDMPFVNVTCELQRRLRANESRSAELTFVLSSSFIGNEPPFNIMLEILVDQTNSNNDTNLTNNVQTIQFTATSRSDISIELMEFSQSVYQYASQVPIAGSGANQFGDDVSLQVDVANRGPSVIQMSRIEIAFPSRNVDITGSNFYFLYPATFRAISEGITTVNCTLNGLDPEGVESGEMVQAQVGRRRRRSVYSQFTTSRWERRRAARERPLSVTEPEERNRQKRQSIVLDCGEANCDIFTCNIQRLTTEGITFRVGAVLDERFYSVSANSREFMVTATSRVSVISEFQKSSDDPDNDMDTASAIIRPEPVVAGPGNLLHVILWPIIGGILILIVLVILLYCLGFFRRKKKPGDDEEVEGDFDAPPESKGEGTTM